MEERHRQTITKNLLQLVHQVDIERLIPVLLQKRVFSEAMIQKYEPTASSSLVDCKTNLFLDIQQRGPRAFQNLVDSLVETGYFDVAKALQPNVNLEAHFQNGQQNRSSPTQDVRDQSQGTVPTQLPRYLVERDPKLPERIRNLALQQPGAHISLRTEPRKVKVKMASERLDLNVTGRVPAYRMGSRPKGYLLLINNIQFVDDIEEERIGAEVDERDLSDLFEQLGYIVIRHKNQGGPDMKRKIEEFATMEQHKGVDSCAVAIMSHGHASRHNPTFISGSDGSGMFSEDILECFTNDRAPLLAKKPKIFFFQCCRGQTKDNGVSLCNGGGRSTATDGALTSPMRTWSDMFIAYSTVPGYVSHRDTYLGSWYIEKICDVFMDHAHDTDIEHMLKMVDERMGRLLSENSTMQTSTFEARGFHCRLFFNPGLYDEEAPGAAAMLPN